MRTVLLLTLLFITFSQYAQNRPIVGAIRWDAWLGASDNIGKELNKSLGPLKWHYRLPFFATVINDNSVDIDGTSQAVMDQEIQYAKYGKLDYFAFLLYNDSYSLSTPLHNYLKSSYKSDVNFCVIAQEGESVSRILNYLKEPSYQKVLDGRFLVYTYQLRDNPTFAQALKDSCAAKGWKEPYIVDLHWDQTMPSSSKFNAITRYWYEGSWATTDGSPYSKLQDYAKWDWNTRLTNNAKQVPMVSLGADGRPRIENPVSWITDPVSMYSKYYLHPTPEQFISHLQEAFDFIRAHPTNCEANAVLMYAWNENDEGGWLVPTLNSDGSINTERLDALRNFLLGFDEMPYFSSIAIESSAAVLQPGDSIKISAKLLDQFGVDYDTILQIQWTTDLGTLSSTTGSQVLLKTNGVDDGATITVTIHAGGKSASATIQVESFGKLSGTVMGSSNASNPLHGEQYAFDNDLVTYTEIDGYPRHAGLNFGETVVLSEVRYYTRTYYEARMPGCQIEVSDDGINWTIIYTIASGEAQQDKWNVITLDPAVEAKYARFNHPSNWLTVAEIEFWGAKKGVVTAVAETNERRFSVYPNPAGENLILNFEFLILNFNTDIEVSIKNIFGQSIFNSKFKTQNSKFEIDVSQFSPGIYFIRIGNEVQKFIIE